MLSELFSTENNSLNKKHYPRNYKCYIAWKYTAKNLHAYMERFFGTIIISLIIQ